MKRNQQRELLESIVCQKRYSTHELAQRRAEVFREVIRNSEQIHDGNFKSLSNEDLGIVFHAIDDLFFEGCVSSVCETTLGRPLMFRLSTRMTTSGGMTTMHQARGSRRREFEIAVATTPLYETFKFDKTASVGGVACYNRLEALQRIMEHEMIHLIELLLWNRSSCATDPFRGIVKRLFGHTESSHQLLTPRDVAQKVLGVRPGDQVLFDFQGETLQGVVNRISKRATVLVSHSGGLRYDDGCRYQKYYVPLNRLRPLLENTVVGATKKAR